MRTCGGDEGSDRSASPLRLRASAVTTASGFGSQTLDDRSACTGSKYRQRGEDAGARRADRADHRGGDRSPSHSRSGTAGARVSELSGARVVIREIEYQKELKLPIEYKGARVEPGYRLGFIVAQTVVVECKAVEAILPVHEAQLLTYLRLTGLPVGLMINFNVPVLKNGILRRVNTRSTPNEPATRENRGGAETRRTRGDGSGGQ